MKREIIVPPTGLLPHRPYSPAVLLENLLFVSGHTGSDPVTREIAPDITTQTELAFDNLRAIIESAGGTMADILKVTVFMTDMATDFEGMNAVFRRTFPDAPPARTTVGVSHLARAGLKVEIEVIAYIQ